MKGVRMMNRNKKENKKMLTDEAVDNLFRTLYYKEISNGDEFIQGLWRRVSPSMMQMLKTIGLEECETVMIQKRSNLQLKKSELNRLESVIHTTVPELRKETTASRAGDDRVKPTVQ